MAPVKQLVALRRKAGLTKEEYCDYHYQKHGAVSTAPTATETPRKYFQTHFIDAAYHADPTQHVPNAHPPWAFSDGVTELYFDSPEHLKHVFQSEWVAQKVGPDGANFSDFSAVLPMFVREDTVPLSIASASASETHQLKGNAFVAMYFVALHSPRKASETVISELVSCIDCHASQDVLAMLVNTPDDTDFDLGSYFGGEPPVSFQFIFTMTLRGKESISAIRKAQEDFEERVQSLDLPATWIGFGERAVVLDQTENIKVSRTLVLCHPTELQLITKLKFDPRRQPFKRSI
ncbi:EthD domain-containing protein [Aspergillus caelatus]|uniref:EthD domain-containing protein n=1 Tax=Aspergillus caelatus TaxID=61420 RepID=A0A5N7A519_9EURO|nr:EthD domain-containing protein [Aspergillus caelatus]KAE8364279.1 EthD domain-containing protein [Aspergillus caelatus]